MASPPATDRGDAPSHGIPLGQAVRFWVGLGFVNFGGPTGQIAIMHEALVVRRRWIGEDRFLHALSFSMLLPGPEAQQLAIYLGWLLHGTLGGIVAGVFFVLPAFLLLLVLSWVYAAHGDLTWVAAIVDGLSAAVVGIVVAALLSIASRALRTRGMAAVALVSFVAIWLVGVPFPIVIAFTGVLGYGLARWAPSTLPRAGEEGEAASDPEADREGEGEEVAAAAIDDSAGALGARPSAARFAKVLAVGLAAWFGPLLLVAATTGIGSIYAEQAAFFSQTAVITFGGAYAVLAYIGQEAVRRFGLTAGDVVAGLGLAETTPGPLIMVVEFLGFLAAYRNPGNLDPLVAGILGAAVATWATFAPSFLWIFLGAPYVERLRGNRRLRGALTAITAAVVGVIASLSLVVAVRVLFDQVETVRPFNATIALPVWSSVDPFHVAVALAAFVAIRRFRVHVAWVVLGAAVAGLAWNAVG
jgi:chromate transporter